MRFDILTIFPDFFRGPFDFGVVPRAFRDGLAGAHIHDLRAFTHDRHRTVDDRPFGGGEGMVLKAQPIYDCLQSLDLTPKTSRDAARSAGLPKETVILLSAQGRRFTQATARRLSTLDRVVLICGRYEGVDERVSQLLCDEELSIGDFVLSGGELAAAIVVDAVVRLLPGVLGHADSSRYESFGENFTEGCGNSLGQCFGECGPAYIPPESHPSPEDCHSEEHSDKGPASILSDASQPPDAGAPGLDFQTRAATEPNARLTPPRSTHASGGLLDYPHYTRPAEFLGVPIPEPLGSGDHLAIRRWRRRAALAKTLANRPDLLSTADLSDDDREFLASLKPD